MATIDLGKIKLVYRGAYNNSTAYTIDDVVQHTDSGLTSSFICTTASTGNAPSTSGTVHGSWSYLAKGAAGSVLTTQGDILFRDASGDQRLAKGTAAQTLKMNSGATAPEWATVTTPSADWVKIVTATGGGTSALAIDSCFSADYDNYMIVGNIFTSSTGNVYVKVQNASNTEQSSAYYYCGMQVYRNSSGGSGYDAKVGWNDNHFSMHESIEAQADNFGQYIIYFNKPFVSTCYTLATIDYHSFDGGSFRTVRHGGSHRQAQSNAGMRFTASSGNITSSSTATVYGLKA